MIWHTVDSTDDLEHLDQLVTWEDAELVEYYGRLGHEPHFPPDVCRSGYLAQNLQVLYRAPQRHIAHVELVFIHCEWFSFEFLKGPVFQGRVDSLLRVELRDRDGSLLTRCARLIYRVHRPDETIEPGFLARQLVSKEEMPGRRSD